MNIISNNNSITHTMYKKNTRRDTTKGRKYKMYRTDINKWYKFTF